MNYEKEDDVFRTLGRYNDIEEEKNVLPFGPQKQLASCAESQTGGKFCESRCKSKVRKKRKDHLRQLLGLPAFHVKAYNKKGGG